MMNIRVVLVTLAIACLTACGSSGSSIQEVGKAPVFLNVEKSSAFGDQVIVAGTVGAKIGSVTFSSNPTEGVQITNVDIGLAPTSAAAVTNLSLKDSATGALVGSIISTPSAGNGFAVGVAVPKSSAKTVDIYANVLAGAAGTILQATVTTATRGIGETTGTVQETKIAVPLQSITIGSGTLSVNPGPNDPASSNVIAGTSSVRVGQFNFVAGNTSYTTTNLTIPVPLGAASSVTNVTLSYKDRTGVVKTAAQALVVNPSLPFASATFTGLSMYVPRNDSANLDVFVGVPTIASDATSGAAINVALEGGATLGTFRAIDTAGLAVTEVNAGTTVASAGSFYVRKSIPTFATLSGQGGTIAPTNPLYRFSITADPAGAIEWTKLVFSIAHTNATLTNVFLVDEATGASLLDSGEFAQMSATTATIDLTKNVLTAPLQQVAAGATKTYSLLGTVTGFTTGSILSIGLARDTSSVINAEAAAVKGNFVWSDRSSSSHSLSSPDWTNGYLLTRFLSSTVTYTK